MPPQVQILDNVLKRLDEIDTPTSGTLFGVMYEGKVLIVGVGFQLRASSAKEPVWYDSAQKLYPTGIDWCGVFTIDDDLDEPENHEVKKKMKDVVVTNNPLYLRKDIYTGRVHVYYSDGANLKFCDYFEIKEDSFMNSFVYLRLIGMTRVCLPLEPSRNNINKEMEKLSTKIAAGMFFKLDESSVYLNKYSNKTDCSSLGSLYDSLVKEKDYIRNMEVLNVHAMFPQGPSIKEVSKIVKPRIYDYACPKLVESGKSEKHFKLLMSLPFDSLCIAHRDRQMDEVYDLLIDTAERTVLLCESYLIKYIRDPLKVHNLRAHHFFPSEIAHPLSLVFSTEKNDERLTHIREQVHTFLNLRLDKPYFRKANSLTFLPTTYVQLPLINVHQGVRPSGIPCSNSKSAITKGAYHYYHYMMDGINDQGWGCAYRSFQTIFSWFKLQGYTSKEVPTHLEIQECLVSIGDKPSSFKGSKSWIGSTEVSYVLESKLNVTSMILSVTSGSEMGSLGMAILEHFENEEVPIMIGGGVLAHTILGIDINEETGDMKFLVLDPHYSENDDLVKIQKKGFVGWKGIDFWDSRFFYNLCLPQRPRCY